MDSGIASIMLIVVLLLMVLFAVSVYMSFRKIRELQLKDESIED